jgi:hypothetical protein
MERFVPFSASVAILMFRQRFISLEACRTFRNPLLTFELVSNLKGLEFAWGNSY